MDLRLAAARWIFGLALVAPGAARAEDLAVTRAEALRLGAERGHAVVEARAPLATVPAARDAASAALPYAPRFSGFAGARRGDLGLGSELGGSVVQELSLRGLGGARRDAAAAFDRAGRSELERARLEGAGSAVLAWIDALEAQELVVQRRRSRDEAEAIARVARARAERGIGMPMEASLASAEVGAAELAERDAEGRLFEARSALRFAIAVAPDAAVRAVGTLAPPDAGERPVPREHPAAAAARDEALLVSADAKAARAQATATLGLGVAYAREGTGEQTLTGMISVPLPLGDPTRYDAARYEAVVLSAQAREGRVRAEIARDVVLARHEREHTREVHATLRDKVLVPLRESVRIARAAYEAGTQDSTTLLLLRQRLVAAEEKLQRAAAEVLRADVRYAVARGTLLDEVPR